MILKKFLISVLFVLLTFAAKAEETKDTKSDNKENVVDADFEDIKEEDKEKSA